MKNDSKGGVVGESLTSLAGTMSILFGVIYALASRSPSFALRSALELSPPPVRRASSAETSCAPSSFREPVSNCEPFTGSTSGLGRLLRRFAAGTKLAFLNIESTIFANSLRWSSSDSSSDIRFSIHSFVSAALLISSSLGAESFDSILFLLESDSLAMATWLKCFQPFELPLQLEPHPMLRRHHGFE